MYPWKIFHLFGCSTSLPEIDNKNMFKTVRDFLIRFEVILDYFRVDIENDWYRYRKLAIYNGQDERSINWFNRNSQSSDFKTSKWKHIRELLISKFGQIITYKDYREELFKCRQLNGEYLHTYMDRYIDLIVEAEFEDTVFLVHCFLHLLLDPVRECVIKKLAAIRKEEETASNGCYTTVYDTLAQVQVIFEREKRFFNDELDKIFPLIEESKSPRSRNRKRTAANRNHRKSSHKRQRSDREQYQGMLYE